MSRPRQVAVAGPGTCDEALASIAEEVGRGVAERGATLVCGGLGGVMGAAARGARSAGGEAVGVVPGSDPAEANEHCSVVVATAAGQARNVAVAASADVLIAVGGSWGTLSEAALARRYERPVIALMGWKVTGPGADGVMHVDSAAEALDALDALLDFRQ